MYCVPPWTGVAAGADVGTGTGVVAPAPPVTLTFTLKRGPNSALLGACNPHTPECAPAPAGATIGSEMSAVASGAVRGTGKGEGALICSPDTKTIVYPLPQAHVPVF